MAVKKGSTRPSGTIAQPQTAEDIRNLARGKAGLAEAQANAAKSVSKTTKITKTDKTTKTDTTSAAAIAEAERLRREAEAEAERLRNRIVIDDTEERIDSIAYLQDLFAQYGLASLANTIVDLKQQGLRC